MSQTPITMKLEGNKLTIVVELGEGQLSSTGKSLVLASTNGFTPVSDVKVNLNVIKQR